MANDLTDPLDRPVWAALTTRQATLAQGEGGALRFDPDYEPFAAARADRPSHLRALAALATGRPR